MTIQMYICLMHAHMREKFFAPVISRTFNLYTGSADQLHAATHKPMGVDAAIFLCMHIAI